MTVNEKIPYSMLGILKIRIISLSNCRILRESSCKGTMFPVRVKDDLVVVIKCTSKSQQVYGTLLTYTELDTLVETLGSIMHRNLVRLMAYVCITDYHVMVYEFILGCTLEEALEQVADRKLILSWPERHRILCDVARGLEHLHTGVSPSSSIVLRHLCPTNILLTEGYKSAMITGVGSAIIVYHNSVTEEVFDNPVVLPAVCYLAPEWLESRFSSKSDVFSYGVVMAQLVTGRDPPYQFSLKNWDSNGQWLHALESGGIVAEAIDPTLRNSDYEAEILQAMKIAVFCAHKDPDRRPEISQVLTMLREIRNPDTDPADDNVSDDSPV